MGSFKSALEKHFKGAMHEHEFVTHSVEVLKQYGFTPENTIPAVGLCRDEICRSFSREVEAAWSPSFDFSSLAGMNFLGKTGFGAFHAHSPNPGGKQRYVYFGLAHIAIDAKGEIGKCARRNRDGESKACGALVALQGELDQIELGDPKEFLFAGYEAKDMDQTMLKLRLVPEIEDLHKCDLVALTKLAREVIHKDLCGMAHDTVPKGSDYAVFTGVQIHGPEEQQLVWPGEYFVGLQGAQFPDVKPQK